jgi:hypothetical protein
MTNELRIAQRFSVQATLEESKLGKLLLVQDETLGAPALLLQVAAGVQVDDAVLQEIVDDGRKLADGADVLVTYAAGRDESGAWLATEAPAGGLLDEILKRRDKLEIGPILQIGLALGRALEAMTVQGVQHLDLGPHRVWVDGGALPGATRVFGAGWWRLLPAYTHGAAAEGFYGQPEFLAAELCKALPATTTSDVYSAALVLWALAAQKPPFSSSQPLMTLKRQAVEKPLRLDLVKPALKGVKDLQSLLGDALEKDPARRPAAALWLASLEAAGRTWAPDLLAPAAAPITRAALTGAPAPATPPSAAPTPAPVEPVPVEPAAVEIAPAEPAPVEPAAAEPAPVAAVVPSSLPTDFEPTVEMSVLTMPVGPPPSTPAPTAPPPSEPAPTQDNSWRSDGGDRAAADTTLKMPAAHVADAVERAAHVGTEGKEGEADQGKKGKFGKKHRPESQGVQAAPEPAPPAAPTTPAPVTAALDTATLTPAPVSTAPVVKRPVTDRTMRVEMAESVFFDEQAAKIERELQETAPSAPPAKVNKTLLAVVIVFALAMIGLAAWMITGNGAQPPVPPPVVAEEPVAVEPELPMEPTPAALPPQPSPIALEPVVPVAVDPALAAVPPAPPPEEQVRKLVEEGQALLASNAAEALVKADAALALNAGSAEATLLKKQATAAAEKAAADKVAAEKVAAEQAAKDKAAADKAAKDQAAADKAAAKAGANDKAGAAKAAAAEKAAIAKAAAEQKAAAAKVAKQAAAEKAAADKAAAAEKAKVVAEKAKNAAEKNATADKAAAEKKAIADKAAAEKKAAADKATAEKKAAESAAAEKAKAEAAKRPVVKPVEKPVAERPVAEKPVEKPVVEKPADKRPTPAAEPSGNQVEASKMAALAQKANKAKLKVLYLQKAVKLDPTNSTYKSLLKSAEAELAAEGAGQ